MSTYAKYDNEYYDLTPTDANKHASIAIDPSIHTTSIQHAHEQSDKPQIIETTNNQISERKSQENDSNTTSQPMPNNNLRNNDIGSVKNKDSQFLEDIRPRIPPDKMDQCQTPIRSPKMKEQSI